MKQFQEMYHSETKHALGNNVRATKQIFKKTKKTSTKMF